MHDRSLPTIHFKRFTGSSSQPPASPCASWPCLSSPPCAERRSCLNTSKGRRHAAAKEQSMAGGMQWLTSVLCPACRQAGRWCVHAGAGWRGVHQRWRTCHNHRVHAPQWQQMPHHRAGPGRRSAPAGQSGSGGVGEGPASAAVGWSGGGWLSTAALGAGGLEAGDGQQGSAGGPQLHATLRARQGLDWSTSAGAR